MDSKQKYYHRYLFLKVLMDIESILEFIKRRFPQNCDWDTGNCWWFAAILQARFTELEIWYEPVKGHFYAGNKDGTIFYDWYGAHINLKDKPILINDIIKSDPKWAKRLIRDCIM